MAFTVISKPSGGAPKRLPFQIGWGRTAFGGPVAGGYVIRVGMCVKAAGAGESIEYGFRAEKALRFVWAAITNTSSASEVEGQFYKNTTYSLSGAVPMVDTDDDQDAASDRFNIDSNITSQMIATPYTSGTAGAENMGSLHLSNPEIRNIDKGDYFFFAANGVDGTGAVTCTVTMGFYSIGHASGGETLD